MPTDYLNPQRIGGDEGFTETPAQVAARLAVRPAFPDPNSIVDTLKSQGMDSSRDSRAALYEKAGLGTRQSYIDAGSNNATQNIALNKYYTTGAGKPVTTGIVTDAQSKAQNAKDIAGNTVAMDSLKQQLPAVGTQREVRGTDGKLTGWTQSDGSFTPVPVEVEKTPAQTPDPAGNVASAETIKVTAFDGTVFNMSKGEINPQAKADSLARTTADTKRLEQKMREAANYNVFNDPIAQEAVRSITREYGVLIQQMQDKNRILAGVGAANAARSGALQFANEMNESVKSEALDRATARVADLQGKMRDAISKSNEAYRSGNVKALEAAQKDYSQSVKDTQNALNDLSKELRDQIKSNQEQDRIQMQALRDQQAMANMTTDNILASNKFSYEQKKDKIDQDLKNRTVSVAEARELRESLEEQNKLNF